MENTLYLLQHRRSFKKFTDKAPNREQLENILKAALRVPDHGLLKPYQFIVIERTGLAKFESYLLDVAKEFDMGERGIEKAKKLAYRAPMVIGVVAKYNETKKDIPQWEQMLTAGCATYAIQLAANTQGFNTSWITNKWVNGRALRDAFGCKDKDKIIAILHIGGTIEGENIALTRQSECTDYFVKHIK